MRLVLISIFMMAVVMLPDLAVTWASSIPENEPTGMTLNAIIGEALQKNPRLLAAQERLRAARSRVSLTRGLPDPELDYEYDRITSSAASMGSGKSKAMRSIEISQEIPFPTKLFLRKRIAEREAAALNDELEETRRVLVKEVKVAYYNLFLQRKKADLTKDSLMVMRQLTIALSADLGDNKASQQDVLRAQVEAARMQNDLLLYEQEARISLDLLASLLGRDSLDIGDITMTISQVPAPTEEEIVRLSKANRPELRSYSSLLEKARLERSLSRQELLPDVTLKYRREEKDGSFRRGEWAGSVGVNVPVWFWGKQMSEVREARANFEAAQADYRAEENSVVYEAKSALARYDAARAMAKVYETGILPQAAGTATASRRAYESGTGTLADLLEALKMQRQLQSEYAQALAEALTALADLEQVVGTDLEK